jgi:hypothetical protein
MPIVPVDNCPDGTHMGKMIMDCGFPFHCPMIVDINISETSDLPLNGRLVSTKSLLVVKELTNSIFHPPKYLLNENSIPKEMEGKI